MGELTRNGIFAEFQVSPYKVFTNDKGEKLNLGVNDKEWDICIVLDISTKSSY